VRKDTFRLLMLIGVIGFAVLYGMELASTGIHRVYGPIEDPVVGRPSPSDSDDEEWRLPPRHPSSSVYVQNDPYDFPRNDREPLLDRLSSATAETLHHISSGGIRLIVSLIEKVTGS
jgi:hypothetical protein